MISSLLQRDLTVYIRGDQSDEIHVIVEREKEYKKLDRANFSGNNLLYQDSYVHALFVTNYQLVRENDAITSHDIDIHLKNIKVNLGVNRGEKKKGKNITVPDA